MDKKNVLAASLAASEELSMLYGFILNEIAELSVETGIDADVLLKSFTEGIVELNKMDRVFVRLNQKVNEAMKRKKDS